MLSKVKKKLRPLMPRPFLTFVRKVRRRGPATSPRRRLTCSLEGGIYEIKAKYIQKRWHVRSLVVIERESNKTVSLPLVVNELGFSVLVDLDQLMRALDSREGIFDLYLEEVRIKRNCAPESTVNSDTALKTRLQRLGRFTETVRQGDGGPILVGGTEVFVDVTSAGNISLVVGDSSLLRSVKVSTQSIQNNSGKASFLLEAQWPTARFVNAVLVAVGRQTKARVELPTDLALNDRKTAERNGVFYYSLSACLDFAEVAAKTPETEDTIDLILELEDEAGKTHSRRVPAGTFEHQRRALSSNSVEHSGAMFHYVPYLTFRAQNLSYRVDTFSPDAFRYLRRICKVAWMAPLVKPFLGIWLIGEVPYKAQDNGYQFFKYLREKHPERRAYYVINKNSPDRAKVEKLGNVVLQHSKKHILMSVLASRLVGSHHAEYLLPTRDEKIQRWMRGVRIFLQHGPTAQKNVTEVYGRQMSLEKPTERFLVTSDLEKKIVVEDYGYRPHQVSVVGFARFDALFEQDIEKKPTVLIMPTWRDNLMQEDTFLQSDYFRSWRGLLTDKDFRSVLANAGLKMTFVLHPNMRKYVDHFAVDSVDVIRQEDADIQRLMKESSVLITDFSSVAWDFSYQDRPVLYFQFDRGMLTGRRQPHIDFETSLPGPIGRTIDEVVDSMKQVLANGCEISPEYLERSRAFLKHKDQRNCDRIYEAVRKAWTPLTAFERVRNARGSQRLWKAFRSGRAYIPAMQAMAWFGAQLPRKDIVLFESDRGTSFGDAPRYIYERLIQRDHGLRIIWANNTPIRFCDESTEKIKRFTPRYWWLASRARYWVSNQQMSLEMRKPNGTQFLQTWHGTPLKRLKPVGSTKKIGEKEHLKRYNRAVGYWDALLSASPYATKAFRSAFGYSGDVLEVGYPRNDVFSWPDSDQRLQQTKARLGISGDRRKIVLYAPTFRDDNRKGRWWKHDLQLDLDTFFAELGDDYLLLTRFHPLVRNPLPSKYKESEGVLDVSRYPDIQELLLMSDVLVTDYSSIFFDYAALRRPMIFFAYDLEDYRDRLRGFYLDYEQEVPGPIVRNTSALVRAVREFELPDDSYLDRIDAFRATYGPLDDGGASDRVIDRFFGRLPEKAVASE